MPANQLTANHKRESERSRCASLPDGEFMEKLAERILESISTKYKNRWYYLNFELIRNEKMSEYVIMNYTYNPKTYYRINC